MLLEPVGPDNYEAALALRVKPSQEHLIASVVKSLADAFVWRAEPRVARIDDQVVGFVMVFPFTIGMEPVVNIVRLMIDQRFQTRGYGRALLDETVRWIGSFQPTPKRIRVSTFPENEPALHLYRSVGFDADGVENGEVVLWRELTEAETR